MRSQLFWLAPCIVDLALVCRGEAVWWCCLLDCGRVHVLKCQVANTDSNPVYPSRNKGSGSGINVGGAAGGAVAAVVFVSAVVAAVVYLRNGGSFSSGPSKKGRPALGAGASKGVTMNPLKGGPASRSFDPYVAQVRGLAVTCFASFSHVCFEPSKRLELSCHRVAAGCHVFQGDPTHGFCVQLVGAVSLPQIVCFVPEACLVVRLCGVLWWRADGPRLP